MVQILSTNTFTVAKWIVSADATQGTHTTITAAISSAASGDTIEIRDGSYTENFTVSKNLNFIALSPESRESNPLVSITGLITVSGTTLSVGFFGIRFNTNSANSFSLTGNTSSITCQNCYFNGSNANSISITGNASTNFYLENCSGSFASTFTLFTTTNGNVFVKNCLFIDTAGTLTASTTSTGSIYLRSSSFSFPFATTSVGQVVATNCQFGTILSPNLNQIWLTTAGTISSYLEGCILYSGTASAISVGTGTTVEAYDCIINSSNTNAITGAGTFKSDAITYNGASFGNNTTTRTFAPIGETGTFTPGLTFGGAAVGITYVSQTGTYNRIGNLVTFRIDIQLSNKGSSTGTALISGLPYQPSGTTIFVISASSLTFIGQIDARNPGGTVNISLDSFASAGGRTALADTAFVNATFLQISGSYLAI